MITPDEILTVLTLHEMNLEECPAYKTLSKAMVGTQQKGRLFVYDNSLESQTMPVNSFWMIDYIHDATNPGVSRAYNHAYLSAKRFNSNFGRVRESNFRLRSPVRGKHGRSNSIFRGGFRQLILITQLTSQQNPPTPTRNRCRMSYE